MIKAIYEVLFILFHSTIVFRAPATVPGFEDTAGNETYGHGASVVGADTWPPSGRDAVWVHLEEPGTPSFGARVLSS